MAIADTLPIKTAHPILSSVITLKNPFEPNKSKRLPAGY